MYRAGFIILLFCFACVPPGCSRQGHDATIRLALQTEPTTLDPAFSVDFSSGKLSSLIHSNLVAFDPDA